MPSLAEENNVWVPHTEEDRTKVREQMNRLLKTSHFKNSRRYPALFRFIVEETLEGRGEFLKERLLGIRVFDRPADYDTATDPIVRVTIAEIRKRIAQYYHEEAHEHEMRIELLPGCYEPEFRPRPSGAEASAAEIVRQEAAVRMYSNPAALVAPVVPVRAGRFSRRVVLSALGVIAAALVASSLLLWRVERPTALEEFWADTFASQRSVTFCLPTGAGRSGAHTAAEAGLATTDSPDTIVALDTPAAPNSSTTFLEHEALGENVVFSDAMATVKISDFVAAHHRESTLRLNTSTTLEDLRSGPTVLIGGLDNQWSLRALAPFRYRFSGTNNEQYWISDAKHPERHDWALDLKTKYDAVKRDYALIARIHDEATGQVEVVAAGIGMSGTAAAGQFLVDAKQMDELRRIVGPGFRDHDVEVVLRMDVVNGIAGSPKILAVDVR